MISNLSVARILRAIDGASERWSNPDFPPRVRAEARIRERMGYSAPVVEYALDRLFAGARSGPLIRAITRELGQLAVLDDFVPSPGGGRVHAHPAGDVLCIASRTTIGVALPSALFALCAKARVRVKDRADGLIAAYFATLLEEEPRLAGRLEATQFNRDDVIEYGAYAAVVAFGADATLETLASRMPAHVRFIGYGARISGGIISAGHAASSNAWRAAAARDAVLYEGEGCMSMHVLFVAAAAEHAAFASAHAIARDLHRALEEAAIEFPPATFGESERLRLAQAAKSLRFMTTTQGGLFVEGPTASVAVARVAPPGLPRTVVVVPVGTAEDVTAYLREFSLPLEALAYDPADTALPFSHREIAAARYAEFGRLQDPDLALPHDGRPRIADFIAWQIEE